MLLNCSLENSRKSTIYNFEQLLYSILFRARSNYCWQPKTNQSENSQFSSCLLQLNKDKFLGSSRLKRIIMASIGNFSRNSDQDQGTDHSEVTE